jgi:hypothetical protein
MKDEAMKAFGGRLFPKNSSFASFFMFRQLEGSLFRR